MSRWIVVVRDHDADRDDHLGPFDTHSIGSTVADSLGEVIDAAGRRNDFEVKVQELVPPREVHTFRDALALDLRHAEDWKS